MVIERARKSDLSKERIREAARTIFARDGYDRATLRSIAATAGMNVSLAIRYFGSKEELFAEVTTLDLRIEALVGLPREQLGQKIVSHALDLWEDPVSGAALAAMVRASVTSQAARDRITAQLSNQVGRLFAGFDGSIVTIAPLVATQIIGMTMARFIWRIPFVATMPRETLVLQVGQAVQRTFDQYATI